MTASPIVRRLTCAEAIGAFEDAGDKRSAPRSYIIRDVLALQAIADVLAKTVRQVAGLFAGLDTGRRVTDAQGRAAPPAAFTASEADEYALVEALFWDRLSDEAELLLKTLLRTALREQA